MIFVNKLSDEARQDLNELLQNEIGRIAQRALIVLWSSEQIPVSEIAQRLYVKAKTVRKWIHRYQQDGVEGLYDLARSGRPSLITPGIEQSVFMQVNQPPYTFGYVFAFWTVATLTQHLISKCWQQVSPWIVRRVLLKLGFRCRRPKLGPRLVDPDRQAIHQYIGKRIAEAPPETVVIVEDETDLRLVPLLRRMWMKLCKQIILPAPITNQCRTIFGAINIHTGEIFYRYFARKRTIEMIAFLEDMMIHYRGQHILLILDHASIHKSRALILWIEQHPLLELIYLPKYAVHRDNPIEKLWWRLKGFVTANRCCRSMDELLAVADKFLKRITPEEVFQLVT